MDQLVARHERVLLRTVDIVGWKSEASSQAAKDFELECIPHLRVFDGQGRMVGVSVHSDYEALERAVSRALGP